MHTIRNELIEYVGVVVQLCTLNGLQDASLFIQFLLVSVIFWLEKLVLSDI